MPDFSKWILGSTLILLIGFIVIYPIYNQEYCGPRDRTLTNIKQLGIAVIIYTVDHDDRYPLSANWAEAVNPYVRNWRTYACETSPSPSRNALNQNIGGTRLAPLDNPSRTVLLFECAFTNLNPIGGASDVDYHHLDGKAAYVVKTDGRVKLHTQEEALALTWTPKINTKKGD